MESLPVAWPVCASHYQSSRFSEVRLVVVYEAGLAVP